MWVSLVVHRWLILLWFCYCQFAGPEDGIPEAETRARVVDRRVLQPP